MQTSEKLAKLLPRVEPVEWWYDGLNGKIIPWTLEHGGTSHDPSAQAFLVGRDGTVVSRCPDGRAYNASGFAKWLTEEVAGYERAHPRTAVPFVPAEARVDGDTPVCDLLAEARAARKPVLLYVGRDAADDGDRAAKKQLKACRKFEKACLSSKKAAAAAAGWTLLRFDLSRAPDAAFAKTLGVEAAPALLLWAPGEDGPVDLGTKLRGANLAYHLKKNAAPR